MSNVTRGSILQRVSYPRSSTSLQGVPFHALLGWQLGDPEQLIGVADLVIAVDVMTREEILVFGQAALFPVEFGGVTASLMVLAVELDLDSDEVDALATLVEFVKGDHDLPWEVG
jgi:hypothetical protein